jgi:hypothetical protein
MNRAGPTVGSELNVQASQESNTPAVPNSDAFNLDDLRLPPNYGVNRPGFRGGWLV